MAVIHFGDGSKQVVKPEVGISIWQVLNGEVEPTEEQERYCSKVSRVYLSWRTAPDSYIEAHFDSIARQIINGWMVAGIKNGRMRTNVHDTAGTTVVPQPALPTRPEPSDVEAVEFCKKWGLIVNGHATDLARKYF